MRPIPTTCSSTLAWRMTNSAVQADAARSLQRALQINPNHYRANLLLGRLLGMQNRPKEALPYLQRAVKLQPKSPDAHKFLGNVYTELGKRRMHAASRWKRIACKALQIPELSRSRDSIHSRSCFDSFSMRLSFSAKSFGSLPWET